MQVVDCPRDEFCRVPRRPFSILAGLAVAVLLSACDARLRNSVEQRSQLQVEFRVDGEPWVAGYEVVKGSYDPSDAEPSTIYEDGYFLAVGKPGGIGLNDVDDEVDGYDDRQASYDVVLGADGSRRLWLASNVVFDDGLLLCDYVVAGGRNACAAPGVKPGAVGQVIGLRATGDDEAVLVFSQDGVGDVRSLRMQGVSPIGEVRSVPNSGSAFGAHVTVVGMTQRAVMAWRTPDSRLFVSDLDATLDQWTPALELVSDADYMALAAPRRSVDGEVAMLAWSGPAGVQAALFDPVVGWKKLGAPPDAAFGQAPAVASSTPGEQMVLWRESGGFRLLASLVVGGVWQTPVDLGVEEQGSEHRLVADAQGNFAAILGSSQGLMLRRYIAGTGWLPPVSIAANARPDDFAVAVDGSGLLAMAYRVEPEPGGQVYVDLRTAPLNVPAVTLAVTVDGLGSVTTVPTGLACPGRCEQGFELGSTVQLTAAAAAGEAFVGWNGGPGCSGTESTLNLTLEVSLQCSALFTAGSVATATLAVAVDGSGRVSGNGIDCPGDCSQAVVLAPITLTAVPDTGWRLAAWADECGSPAIGTGATITLDMQTDRQVCAQFEPDPTAPVLLSVAVTGAGLGSVTSTPAGIACPDDCSESFPPLPLATVTLEARAAVGSLFDGWQGACAGTAGNTAQVTMDGSRSCTARFTLAPVATATLTVAVNGQGSVQSTPDGIDACTTNCSADFAVPSLVTLMASPAAEQRFAAWGGDTVCQSGSETLQLELQTTTRCTATFEALVPSATWQQVSTPPGLTAANVPAVAYDVATSTVYVAFTARQSAKDFLYVRRLRPGDAGWVSLGAAINDSALRTSARGVSIAVLPDGHPVVVWDEAGTIRVTRFDGVGTWVRMDGTPGDHVVNVTPGNAGVGPQIAVGPGQRVVVAWVERDILTQGAAVKRLNPGTSAFEGGLVPGVTVATSVRLGLTDAGLAMLAYSAPNGEGGDTAFAQQESAFGVWSPLGNEAGGDSGVRLSNQTYGFGIVPTPAGQALVISNDARRVESRVFAGGAWVGSDNRAVLADDGPGALASNGIAVTRNGGTPLLLVTRLVDDATRPAGTRTEIQVRSLLAAVGPPGQWQWVTLGAPLVVDEPARLLGITAASDFSPVVGGRFDLPSGTSSVRVYRYYP